MGIRRRYLRNNTRESLIFQRAIYALYKSICLTTKGLVRLRLMSKSLTTQVPAAAARQRGLSPWQPSSRIGCHGRSRFVRKEQRLTAKFFISETWQCV